jgi:hypothetical protein
MKKLKQIFSLLFISVFLLTGCIRIEKNIENKVPNVNNIQDGNKSDNDKNKEDDKSNTNNKENEVSSVSQSKFKILSKDANTNETIVSGSISIDEKLSIEDKLNLVVSEVSKVQFENAPIKLLKIEDNIAYIDISEDQNEKLWSNRFFQGSTGANITCYTLVESLLQREYEGKWIDGIYFTYEGKTDVEFDHVDVDFFGNIIKK